MWPRDCLCPAGKNGAEMAGPVELSGVLEPERVLILKCACKAEALRALVKSLGAAPGVKNEEGLCEAIFRREELMSTGIGMGMGVPHVRLDSVDGPVMSVGICRVPITDYESLDGKPVQLIFMIAAGKYQHTEYIRLLARLSSKLKNEELRNALINAPDAEIFYRILVE